MFDPLSTAAGVVGIAVPALHGTRLLFDEVKMSSISQSLPLAHAQGRVINSGMTSSAGRDIRRTESYHGGIEQM